MAGETPGGARRAQTPQTPAQKQLEAERRARLDQRDTNKTYGSGNVSAISGQTISDTTLKPGEAPKPVPERKVNRLDERSTDKIYASAPLAPTPQQAARGQTSRGELRPLPVPGQLPRRMALPARPATKGSTSQTHTPPHIGRPGAGKFEIAQASDVNGVMAAVIEACNNGAESVTLLISDRDPNLLRRARAAVEQLVTREAITEESYHNIKFAKFTPTHAMPSINEQAASDEPQPEEVQPAPATTKISFEDAIKSMGEPTPADRPPHDDEDGDLDVDAILSGEADAEPEGPSTEAVQANVIDTSVETTPEEKIESDDDDDLLSPSAESSDDAKAAPSSPISEEEDQVFSPEPEVEQPKKKGKKSR